MPRNTLGELIALAKPKELYRLTTIGLHGVTRLQCRQAGELAEDLRVLLHMGEPIDAAWLGD